MTPLLRGQVRPREDLRPAQNRHTHENEPRVRGLGAVQSGFQTQADGETRTPDPFITSEVLYQLSYVGGAPTVAGSVSTPGPAAAAVQVRSTRRTRRGRSAGR